MQTPPGTPHRKVTACRRTLATPRPDGAHEEATLDALARRIAELMSCEYAGVVDPDDAAAGGPYLVPEDTLPAPRARALGVHGGRDLFGGVVPHPFVATKVVTHGAVDDRARVPPGWVRGLSRRLAGAVLPGFSVFGRDDARVAFDALVPLGPVRLKLARGIGGNGQWTVHDRRGLEEALDQLPDGELDAHGATLEQHLEDATTYSIGVAECAGITIAYHGRQRSTRGPHGHEVYAGSELDVIRGGLEELLGATAAAGAGDPGRCELLQVLRQAHRYDAAMRQAYPGFFASRRNYDVVAGSDAHGVRRTGVLEQSWRIGGASPAELVAIEAFSADPALHRVRAACHEVYGECTPPPGAIVHFRGRDPRLGMMTKYATREPLAGVEAHGHAA